jgi:hypothetical protein
LAAGCWDDSMGGRAKAVKRAADAWREERRGDDGARGAS